MEVRPCEPGDYPAISKVAHFAEVGWKQGKWAIGKSDWAGEVLPEYSRRD
jgi:hypothetical protein